MKERILRKVLAKLKIISDDDIEVFLDALRRIGKDPHKAQKEARLFKTRNIQNMPQLVKVLNKIKEEKLFLSEFSDMRAMWSNLIKEWGLVAFKID